MSLFPDFDQLTPEQRRFCRAEHANQTLATGPPGTGKTVVAFHRAKTILRMTDEKVLIVMFNQVLSKYVEAWEKTIRAESGLKENDNRLQIKTWNQWITGWISHWGTMRFLYSYQEVTRWNWKYPWDGITLKLSKAIEDGEMPVIRNWPHLIIDEGQDFSNGFYSLASQMIRNGRGKSITVSADENQTIGEDGSLITEIARKTKTSPEPDNKTHYGLTKNFRNTLQIAKLARHFFAGARTGRPDLPEANVDGQVPTLRTFSNKEDARTRLIELIKSRPTQQIGVFMQSQSGVDDVLAELRKNLGGRTVQYYYNQGNTKRNKELVERLQFEKPGIVTLLCGESVKGIEFDTVVIHDVERYAPDHALFTKRFYVMCSRAREILELHCTCDSGSDLSVLKEFPQDTDNADEEGALNWIR